MQRLSPGSRKLALPPPEPDRASLRALCGPPLMGSPVRADSALPATCPLSGFESLPAEVGQALRVHTLTERQASATFAGECASSMSESCRSSDAAESCLPVQLESLSRLFAPSLPPLPLDRLSGNTSTPTSPIDAKASTKSTPTSPLYSPSTSPSGRARASSLIRSPAIDRLADGFAFADDESDDQSATSPHLVFSQASTPPRSRRGSIATTPLNSEVIHSPKSSGLSATPSSPHALVASDTTEAPAVAASEACKTRAPPPTGPRHSSLPNLGRLPNLGQYVPMPPLPSTSPGSNARSGSDESLAPSAARLARGLPLIGFPINGVPAGSMPAEVALQRCLQRFDPLDIACCLKLELLIAKSSVFFPNGRLLSFLWRQLREEHSDRGMRAGVVRALVFWVELRFEQDFVAPSNSVRSSSAAAVPSSPVGRGTPLYRKLLRTLTAMDALAPAVTFNPDIRLPPLSTPVKLAILRATATLGREPSAATITRFAQQQQLSRAGSNAIDLLSWCQPSAPTSAVTPRRIGGSVISPGRAAREASPVVGGSLLQRPTHATTSPEKVPPEQLPAEFDKPPAERPWATSREKGSLTSREAREKRVSTGGILPPETTPEGQSRERDRRWQIERLLFTQCFQQAAPAEIAVRLAQPELALFQGLEMRELIDLNWRPRRAASQPDGDASMLPLLGFAWRVQELVSRANNVSQWVASKLLTCSDVSKRAQLLEQFIEVADACEKQRLFNTLFEVVSGLQLQPIQRLRRSWAKISSRHSALFASLEALVDCKSNYAVYRARLHLERKPQLPYLGLYLRDLTLMEEGMETVLSVSPPLLPPQQVPSAPPAAPQLLLNGNKLDMLTSSLAAIVWQQRCNAENRFLAQDPSDVANSLSAQYFNTVCGLADEALSKLSYSLERRRTLPNSAEVSLSPLQASSPSLATASFPAPAPASRPLSASWCLVPVHGSSSSEKPSAPTPSTGSPLRSSSNSVSRPQRMSSSGLVLMSVPGGLVVSPGTGPESGPAATGVVLPKLSRAHCESPARGPGSAPPLSPKRYPQLPSGISPRAAAAQAIGMLHAQFS
jgi:hypothetical protein